MKLPDFLHFEPFLRLRDDMGAEHLGDFVFFDPRKNLTGLERLALAAEGLPLEPDCLTTARDFTLVYKDSRVLAYVAAPRLEAHWHYHVAACPEWQAWLNADVLSGSLRVATALPADTAGHYRVCPACLETLRYRQFDGGRQRHREYNARVLAEFSLDEFFVRYPAYPVVIKDDTLPY